MTEAIELVLPLCLRDVPRFEILADSLERCFEGRGTCWVVVPDRDLDAVRRRLPADGYTLVPETTLVPELRLFRRTTGWYRQQVIKLAVAGQVATRFYMTLDADVIATRPVRGSDLVRDGRALAHVTSSDPYPEWYDRAEVLLGLPRSGRSHGVTPCIYSTEAMLSLHDHLTRRQASTDRLAMAAARIPYAGERLRGWRPFLLRHTGWTEQSLYFTFLEGTGAFERYHLDPIEDAIYDGNRSLWFKEQMRSWNPDTAMETGGDAYFIVAQSTTGIDPEVLWASVRRRLGRC